MKRLVTDFVGVILPIGGYFVLLLLGSIGLLNIEQIDQLTTPLGDYAQVAIILIMIVMTYIVGCIFVTPMKLFFEQKEKAELYTMKSLDIEGFISTNDNIRPSGIMVINKKERPIKCEVTMTRIWSDKTQIANVEGGLPMGLRWFVDGDLVTGSIFVESNDRALIVLEHIPTMRELGAYKITAQPKGGTEDWKDWGECVGLEFGGKLGIPIYENKYYETEIQFDFVIEGLHLRLFHRYSLDYDGKKLITKGIGDWYHISKGEYEQKEEHKPAAV